MTLDSYIQSLHGKSITVVGLGVSNRPLLRLLLNAGYTVTVRDKRTSEAFGEGEAAVLEAAGCRLVLGEDYLAGITEDVIFRTPGLHPLTPELAAAKERGALLTSEMEAFFAVCPCRIIAVTGSDGKTTTTTIISELLKAQGYRVFLGGNIGTPLLDKVPEMTDGDWTVLELSSFQLHSMDCRPDIAVVTNVSPNHLDVHPSYEDYQTAKKQIFLSQGSVGITVLNADNAITRAFAEDCPGKCVSSAGRPRRKTVCSCATASFTAATAEKRRSSWTPKVFCFQVYIMLKTIWQRSPRPTASSRTIPAAPWRRASAVLRTGSK